MKKHFTSILGEFTEDIVIKAMTERAVLEISEGANVEQLWDGTDALGQSLESVGGAYTPFTVRLKQEKGQPTDRVTLRDTGAFYDSIRYLPSGDGVKIEFDPMKEGEDLRGRWGKDIIGLNKQNKAEYGKLVAENIRKSVLAILLRRA